MGIVPKEMSDHTLERTAKLLLLALIVTTVAIVGYYVNDRYRRPSDTAAERTLQSVEEAVRRDPQSIGMRIVAGDTYLNNKRYDEAIVQYGEALKLAPEHSDAVLGLGLAYMQTGDTAKATEHLEQAVLLRKDKDTAVADIRLQLAYYHLGRLYLQLSQYDLAVERLEAALVIKRTDADSLLLLGNAQYARGDYAAAVAAYRRAVTFVPDFVEAYQGLARGYEQQGDTARAGYGKAMVAYWSGDKAGALGGLERAVAQVKDDADIFWALGLVREEGGQREKAADAYQQAVTIDPKHRLAAEGLNRVMAK